MPTVPFRTYWLQVTADRLIAREEAKGNLWQILKSSKVSSLSEPFTFILPPQSWGIDTTPTNNDLGGCRVLFEKQVGFWCRHQEVQVPFLSLIWEWRDLLSLWILPTFAFSSAVWDWRQREWRRGNRSLRPWGRRAPRTAKDRTRPGREFSKILNSWPHVTGGIVVHVQQGELGGRSRF